MKYLDERTGNKYHSTAAQFLGSMPRRVYKAVPEKFWINSDGEMNKEYIDTRAEIDILK